MKKKALVLLLASLVAAFGVFSQCIIPAQTAAVKTTSYAALAGDAGKMIVMNCASTPCTLTLPATIQSPNYFLYVVSIGAYPATISPNGLNLNGSSGSFVFPPSLGVGVAISTDNSNYFAQSISPPEFYGGGGGTAQAQTVSIVPAPTALYAGLFVAWLPAAANTAAAPTLAVSGLTAKTITKYGTAALNANDLTTTAIAYAIYDGTEFQLLNPQTPRNTQVLSVTDLAPVSGDSGLVLVIDPPSAIHITRVYGSIQGSTNVVLNLDKRAEGTIGTDSGAHLLGSDLTAVTGGANTSTFANGSSQCGATTSCAIAAHAPVVLTFTSVSGTPTSLTVGVEYTVD